MHTQKPSPKRYQTFLAKMVLQFAFHMILLIWPMYPLARGNVWPQLGLDSIIAQPGCDSRCGTVDIPYPFGMKDPKCYADRWFEIECRTNATSQVQKPYLKSINLEVTFIDENLGTVHVMNPIYHRLYQSKDAPPTPFINMKGSPFVYSQQYNKFVAVGCNNLAFLHSDGSEVGGCVSVCEEDKEVKNFFDHASDGCHGRYCCEISLPKYLSEYNATLADLSTNRASDMDNYALIVREVWELSTYSWSLLLSGDRNLFYYAPAVLDWEILNSIHLELTDAECYDTNVTSQQYTHSGRRCHCRKGFQGNPYRAGSCIVRRRQQLFYDERIPAKGLMVGVLLSLGSIILLLDLWWLYKVVKRRMIKKRKENFFKQNGGLLLQQRLSSGKVNVEEAKLFSLKDLEKATDHFNMNRVLGKGGQGTVYKGMLVDSKIVAVKKFRVQGNVKEFINEFVILSQINHRNVVKLLGCCLETEIPLLVYEFIPNGTLFEYLHDQNEDLPMTWDMRLKIATEVAGALFYLHSAAFQPIYHRDIKSTNILLDEKYRAKVADFGISKMVSIEDTHLTTLVKGTFGYLDPEYFRTSQFTEKSDVYSFGVVLAELLTGQKPISSISSEETTSLASSFVLCMEESRLFDIIDKRVTKEGKKEHIIAVANLANRCLDLKGKKRPSMKEVATELEWIRRLERKSNAQQNHEEIELAGIEDYQLWGTQSLGVIISNDW